MAAQHFTAKKEEKKEDEQEEQEAPTQAEEEQTQDRPNFKPACWRERERERLELLAFSFLGLDLHGLAPFARLAWPFYLFFLTFPFSSRPATAH